MSDSTSDPAALIERVRARYAAAASAAANRGGPETSTGQCGCDCDVAEPGEGFGAVAYTDAERAAVPTSATMASLGSGNPLAVADLREGETVLDLGAGGGLDVLLAARQIGPGGTAYGLDMTTEMVELARRNAVDAGVGNAEFLEGRIEAIPLPDASVDVVVSNCVVNLSVDKPAVLAEAARVLRPGGRVAIADVVADDDLTPADRAERGSYVGCIAGALTDAEYRAGLAAAGFADVDVIYSHPVGDGIHSATVTATKPA